MKDVIYVEFQMQTLTVHTKQVVSMLPTTIGQLPVIFVNEIVVLGYKKLVYYYYYFS